MATFNGSAWLARQLDSILSQRDVLVTVDVRDDGSVDGTREVVANYALRDPRVRLRAELGGGRGAAANFFSLMLGADLTDADYIAFSDQDDEWLPDKLARAVACLRERAVEGYSAGVRAHWPDGRSSVLVQNPVQRDADYLFEGAGQGCTFVLGRALFERIHAALRTHRAALERLHYHDWTLYALARTMNAKWYFDQRATMIYHQHGGNDTGARTSGAGVRKRWDQIRKGWYRGQVSGIANLVLACNPADLRARQWVATRIERRPGVRGTLRRLRFVATSGRRRAVDRLILTLAVLLGFL
jgi:rhamnosyltransferase